MICYAYINDTPDNKRTGFMPEIEIPDDFDTLMQDEIAQMFGVDKQ